MKISQHQPDVVVQPYSNFIYLMVTGIMLSPVLLLAEIYTEHSHIFLGSPNTNHHEHAGASHVSFVLNTVLVDMTSGQV